MGLSGWLKKKTKHEHQWEAVKTIWPYPDGYCWYCEGCETMIDSAPTKQELKAMGKPT